MVEVVPGLVMCECSSTGRLAWMKGAVDDARAMVAREYGSFDGLRDKLAQDAEKRKREREEAEKAISPVREG